MAREAVSVACLTAVLLCGCVLPPPDPGVPRTTLAPPPAIQSQAQPTSASSTIQAPPPSMPSQSERGYTNTGQQATGNARTGSCYFCAGTGWTNCTFCQNGYTYCSCWQGYVVCDHCQKGQDGRGYTRCGLCNGVGCSYCGRSGYTICIMCNGLGYYTCPMCGGKQYYVCPMCHGKTAYRCVMCNGTGRTR